jgi:hypothetical protein
MAGSEVEKENIHGCVECVTVCKIRTVNKCVDTSFSFFVAKPSLGFQYCVDDVVMSRGCQPTCLDLVGGRLVQPQYCSTISSCQSLSG